MKYTLGQAAKETGISKPTLSRSIKKGDLSAEGGVDALREQIARGETERARERMQLEAHIADLRGRVDRAERKEDQLMAQLTDQREIVELRQKRGFFLVSRGSSNLQQSCQL